MERFRHLAKTGGAHYLVEHFGNPDTALIDGTVYVSPDSLPSIKGLRARHTDCLRRRPRGLCPAQRLHLRRAGLPDFVLEVASRSTGHIDVQDKPADYAVPGFPEYWRFDETGESHGARLTGDR